MARIYADEDFDRRAGDDLRRLGHDLLTPLQVGRANRKVPDEDVIAFALVERRVVVTHNRRHYITLHRRGRPHAGIIVCTRDPDDPAGLAARIDAVLATAGNLEGKLLRVVRPHRP